MKSDFFSELPAIRRFEEVVDRHNFHAAPADWMVVVADIRSSTKAVNEGRYKDVNMMGGAVLCAVLNASMRGLPFVFGGDGATILIPASAKANVEAALVRTRTLARNDFDLELRVGFVPIETLRARGVDVLVARYEISPGNDLAMFGGGGVELADSLIKADVDAEEYAVRDYELDGPPDLTGLSCRWEPLRAQKGAILCLLVKPHGENFDERQAILARILARLRDIIGPELQAASPVTTPSMHFRWPPKGLAGEAKATRGSKSFVRRYAEVLTGSFIQLVLERFNLKGGNYDAPVYREELKLNSDYCRFDDVLRMVLDCTLPQIEEIRAVLGEAHATGEADFGLFEVEQALMTCLVFDLAASQHMHFIDGDNGGFWSAAVDFKAQMAAHGDRN